MNTIFRKIVLGALTAALVLAALPVNYVYAAGPNDPPAPTSVPVDPNRVNARLEKTFGHQKRLVEQIGQMLDKSDETIARAQELINKAKEKGLNTSAVQAALDALKKALPNATPFYDQAKSIVATHNGFDANGKVTNAETAKATIKSVGDTLKKFHDAMGGTFRDLLAAMKQFRHDNPRPTPVPSVP